jgi:hypothetical protein
LWDAVADARHGRHISFWILRFVDIFDYALKRDGFHRIASSDQGYGVAVECGFSRYFSNPNIDNPFPDLFAGDHSVANVLRTPEVHYAQVVVQRFFIACEIRLPAAEDIQSLKIVVTRRLWMCRRDLTVYKIVYTDPDISSKIVRKLLKKMVSAEGIEPSTY